MSNDIGFVQSLDDQLKQWNPGRMKEEAVERETFKLYKTIQ